MRPAARLDRKLDPFGNNVIDVGATPPRTSPGFIGITG